MPKNTKLRAYNFHQGEPTKSSYLIFHFTAKKAKAFATKKGVGDTHFDYGMFQNFRAERQPCLDEFLDAHAKEPYVLTDSETLRRAGWSGEGDSPCMKCNLSPIDEADDPWNAPKKYSLCEKCGCCTECGHREDCPDA